MTRLYSRSPTILCEPIPGAANEVPTIEKIRRGEESRMARDQIKKEATVVK